MRRRDALRTLGLSGLGVASAGLVHTVPAFAFSVPVVTSPFAMFVEGDTSPMSVVLQPGQATCPGSAVPCAECGAGLAEPMLLQVTASVLSPDASVARWGWGSDGATALLPANEFTSTPVTKSVDPVTGDSLDFVRLRADGSSSLRDPEFGDTLQMVGAAVYRCTYASGDYRELTHQRSVVFTFVGTGVNPLGWDASVIG